MLTCPTCSASVWDGARRCRACGAELPGELSDQTADEDAAAIAALIGRRMGSKFVLRDLIGTGATGYVFRADQVTLGRTVAVKVLREHLASDPEVVRRFHDEALAASRLNHPNTVAVIDYGQAEDGRLYIVMEYLRGRTLTQVLRADYPVPVPRAVALVCQVLDALEEAHACGVVHADLKSDNVVVETLRGGGDLAKVVDFGIARLVETTAEAADRPTTICGTPEYMAPEVICGEELTAAADQYGAACVLYEVLTGRTPFAGQTTVEVLSRQVHEEAVSPRVVRPDLVLPPSVEAALMRALAKRPEARFGSVAELRAALQAGVKPRATSEVGAQAAVAAGTRTCPACGAKNPPSFKFCPECGERVEVTGGALPGLPSELAGTQKLTHEIRTATLRWAPKPPVQLWPLPLVGRANELSALTAFLAGGGVATTMLVAGALGSGRTRLVREAVRRAAEVDIAATIAGPDPSGLSSSWYPIRAAVAAILELPPICPVDALAERLEAAGLSHRDAPGLAELFGQEGALSQLEPVVRRRECMASALRVLRAAAMGKSRAVLVFEDVDRYDPLSVDLLRRLAEHQIDDPVRVILTATGEAAEGWPDGVVRLDLGALVGANLAAISERLREIEPRSPDAEALLRATHGEPVRIEHVVRYFFEGGELHEAPENLPDLIAERLARLPGSVRVVLQAVAVAGLEADIGALTQVVATEEVDEQALSAALELLADHGLLAVDGDIVAFQHPLTRDVVYDAMPAEPRRELHRAFAELLPAHATPAAVLGHHAELGGLYDLAVVRLLTAGDEAVRRFDDHGAAVLYQRALACARHTLHAGDASSEPAARLRDLLTAAIKLADALRLTGNHVLARGVLDEAALLCDGTHKALESQLKRAQAHLALAVGEPARALAPIRDAIGLAMKTGSLDLIAAMYLDVSTIQGKRGDNAEAMRELQEGIDFVTVGEGVAARSGPRSLWRLALRLAELQQAAGRRKDACATATHALRHAMRAHSAVGRGRANTMLAQLHELLGDNEAAARHRAAAVEEMRRLGDRRTTAELLFESAGASQFRIGLDSLEEARALAEEIGWAEGLRKVESG
jgi:serine/threonine-protein kinase